jgi:hypothetical protein
MGEEFIAQHNNSRVKNRVRILHNLKATQKIKMKTIVAPLVLFCLLAYNANGQTTEEIIKNYIANIGGKNNWKKVKTLTTSGEYNYGGISFPFTTYAATPNRYKFIVQSNGKYYAQGFDGKKGWKIDTFKNETTPTILTGPAAVAMANESNVELADMLIDYETNGFMVSYSGKDSAAGYLCYRLKVFRDNGEMETLYFNPENFDLVMKKAVSKNVELDKAPLKIYYSDYRSVDGIRIPFKTVCESDQQVILTITINKASTNTPIDDKEFTP